MAQRAKRAQGRLEAAVIRRFREVMAGQHVSQVSLSEQVGISRGQLTRILNGHKPATFTEAVDIATALGVDLAEVVREAELAPPPPLSVPIEAEVADLLLQADLEQREREDETHPKGCIHPC